MLRCVEIVIKIEWMKLSFILFVFNEPSICLWIWNAAIVAQFSLFVFVHFIVFTMNNSIEYAEVVKKFWQQPHSKYISWMNDEHKWIICTRNGNTHKQKLCVFLIDKQNNKKTYVDKLVKRLDHPFFIIIIVIISANSIQFITSVVTKCGPTATDNNSENYPQIFHPSRHMNFVHLNYYCSPRVSTFHHRSLLLHLVLINFLVFFFYFSFEFFKNIKLFIKYSRRLFLDRHWHE